VRVEKEEGEERGRRRELSVSQEPKLKVVLSLFIIQKSPKSKRRHPTRAC